VSKNNIELLYGVSWNENSLQLVLAMKDNVRVLPPSGGIGDKLHILFKEFVPDPIGGRE
jgi:hypothetical protein